MRVWRRQTGEPRVRADLGSVRTHHKPPHRMALHTTAQAVTTGRHACARCQTHTRLQAIHQAMHGGGGGA